MKRTITFIGLPILVMFIWMLVTSPLQAHAAGKKFKDVPENSWAYTAVVEMVDKGIVNGYTDGTFLPNQSLTREQFSKLLTLALDLDLSAPQPGTFTDVATKSWSFPYVETVKAYFDGYYPPIGKPFFKPAAIATREDVAVALVSALHLPMGTPEQAKKELSANFKDYSKVSEDLMPYVAAALKNQIIGGYPDGTFKPQDGITRAAAMALFSRIMKSPQLPALEDINLAVEAPKQVTGGVVTLKGTSDPNVKLTVNGMEIANSGGSFEKQFQLTKGEGDYKYSVQATKPNGRFKLEEVKVNYTIPAPELNITAISGEAQNRTVRISGVVKDVNDALPKIAINDIPVSVQGNGDWYKDLQLEIGSNVLNIVATNRDGKKIAAKKTIKFLPPPPTFSLNNIPSQVNLGTLDIEGTISDINDANPIVTLNGNKIAQGSFKKQVTLVEGDNTLAFVAANNLGKETVIRKNVKYVILPPKVEFENLSDSTVLESNTFKIKATDLQDDKPKIYVNGIYKGVSEITETMAFREGDNEFRVKAVNSLGKETELIKKVNFYIMPTSFDFEGLPETTDRKTVTFKVNAADLNDTNPRLYFNGSYMDTGSFQKTVTLEAGANTLTFTATNRLSKTTTLTKQVTFVPPAPTLNVDNTPATVTASQIYLKAAATDPNDSSPRLYINDSYVDSGSLYQAVSLREGENTFVIKATNSYGKAVAVTKKITRNVPAPTITVDPIPETVNTPAIMLKAQATDVTDTSPSLYVNGEKMYGSSVNQTFGLTEGANVFEISASNAEGKKTNVTVHVNYVLPVPVITVNSLPTETANQSVSFTVTASDTSDSNPKIYINGTYLGNGRVSYRLDLAEGSNSVQIRAVNASGKETTVNRVVNYLPPLLPSAP